jgi:hypothetical protein
MSLPKWRVAALLAYNMEKPLPRTPTNALIKYIQPSPIFPTYTPPPSSFLFSSTPSDYRLTSATKYGPMTLAAVQTTINPSTITLYGALHSGTSCKRTQTAYKAT